MVVSLWLFTGPGMCRTLLTNDTELFFMNATHQNRNLTSTDANSNVLVRAKAGVLGHITIVKTSAHALGIYDGTDTTTLTNNVLICTIKASIVEATYEFDISLVKGLVISVPASYAGDAAICHRAG